MINESLKNAFKQMWKNNLNLLDISREELNSELSLHLNDYNPHNITIKTIGAASDTHSHLYAGSSSIGGPADYLRVQSSNQINFKGLTKQTYVHFNYKDADTNTIATENLITGYYFNNKGASTTGVTLHAENFSGTAAQATSDGSGNNIVNTYATKAALSSVSGLVGDTSVANQINVALTQASTYTNNEIAKLIDSAPSHLDTLNKLATALGTVSNQIDNKANANHTHNYAGSSSAGGAATSVAYEEGTSDQSRHVWFSQVGSQGKLAYDNDFKYNPATNVLTVGSITGTAAKATSDGSGNNIVNTYATKTALSSISDLVGSTSVASQISSALTTANTYTDNKVAGLVDSAPEALNTLNELAAALGDDANFSTTVLNQIGTKANANHTHNYAGSSSAGGSATSAVKLDSSAGSATQPVYFSSGKPTACTYTLNKSVPSDAVFTDTNTKVTQTAVTASDYTNWRPLVIGASNNSTEGFSPTTVTDTTFTVNTISCQPSSGTIKATTFKGNASTATKLATAKTIALGTGATGTATSFDGSNNITIPVTSVKEAYLDWGGRNINGGVTPVGAALSSEHSANRLAYLNPNAITVEYSDNAGSTWTNYSISDANKIGFVTTSTSIPIGNASTVTTNHRTRITITAQNGTTGYVYTRPRKMLLNVSTSGHGISVTVETKTGASGASWSTFGTYALSGWSGWNDIPLVLSTLGGGKDQKNNIWYMRLTFATTSVSSNYTTSKSTILGMRLFGDTCWTKTSNMGETGHLYSYDTSQNATFPAAVTATTLKGNLAASYVTAGTLGGSVVANATAVGTLTTKQLRNITISTADPTSSDGGDGDVWIKYGSTQSDCPFPVGGVYISIASTDPSSIWAGTTWEQFAKGRTLVGYNSSDSDFATIGKTGGEKTHTLTPDEIPAHGHGMAHTHSYTGPNTGSWKVGTGKAHTWCTSTGGKTSGAASKTTTDNAGGGLEHNNLQPYIVVYMWKRVS